MGVYTTINDPSAYFQTALWTGNSSSTQAITNDGSSNLQPDFVWLKRRSDAENHTLADTSRGITKRLVSNSNAAENTADGVVSVQSDGFTVGGGYNGNNNGATYVGWQWKANGGTTASQTGSDIDSVTQVNTTSKFSIITYTGASNADSDSDNNSGAYWRVKHGLGSTPKLAIFKKRSSSAAWYVWHHKLGGTLDYKYLQLQGTNAVQTESAVLFGNTNWSSTEFEIGAWDVVNRDGTTYVAYMFDEVQGYSKFGSYTGNGNADGPFIYTGFKPAWVLLKRIDSGNNWHLHDAKRSNQGGGNPADDVLYPNLNNAEGDEDVDLISNGFKLRVTGGGHNASGGSYIYMAFAESPFVSSAGVPTTAR